MSTILDQMLRRDDDLDDEVARPRIAPGRVTSTMFLPPRPVQQIVFRDASGAPAGAPVARDGNGVATGAEVAVDRAASSSGQALPDEVRARFEQSLGADLSGVRVHTGAESHAAAVAVGARAYTVGKDIHFADGNYQPADPFGLHLLAHEVAHTVQQGRGAEQRQHKLEVSTPGDSFEREADRAADAMIAGQPAQVSGAPMVAARNPGDPPAAPGAAAAAANAGAAGAAGAVKSVAETVELVSFNFDKGAGVKVSPGEKGVSIDAAPVHLVGEVKIKDSITGDDLKAVKPIKVGTVQNLVSSERVGVYKKGDVVVAEYRNAGGGMNDAQWQDGKTKDAAKVRDPGATAPFYQTPDELNSGRTSATAKMDDAPGFGLPTTMSGGTLVETKGSDSFVTSVAAKRDGDLVHLKQEAWSVPWASQIAGTSGTGGAVTANPTSDKPTVEDGPLPVNSVDWFKFPTVADAKAAPISTLLSALAASRTKDPDSYKNCVQAVNELNWRFTVTVKCTNTYSWVGRDDVTFTAKGHGSFTESFKLNTNESHQVGFNFGTIFNADAWQDGNKISFTVVGDGHTFTASFGPPFSGAESLMAMGGSDGRYQISATRS